MQQLDLKHDQANVALDWGVAMWAKVRVEHRNVADVVDVAAFPERPSASNCPAAYMNSMYDAEQWLVTALGLAGTHGFEKDDARLRHGKGARRSISSTAASACAGGHRAIPLQGLRAKSG